MSQLVNLLPIVGLVLIFWLLILRPAQKRQKEMRALQASLTPGDEVLLFGPGDRGEPTAQDWAEAVGTINYEIVTRVGARVPRVLV